MPGPKPKLPQLQTPRSSTFPSELSAVSASAKSPFPNFPEFIKQEPDVKTPITPPIAYTDFLKSMASPIISDKNSGRSTPTSAPSTASSDHSLCSCSCENHKDVKGNSKAEVPQSPFIYPSSAPTSSRFSRRRVPQSPAYSTIDSPLSATSAIRSPFSATGRSPFDWDIACKRQYFDIRGPKTPRSSVRKVREIVTRTVTYTPRMSPAPKGKRRKIE